MQVQKIEIDISNRHFVAATKDSVVVFRPPCQPMTPEEALVLAAWLVACAESMAQVSFEQCLEQVHNT